MSYEDAKKAALIVQDSEKILDSIHGTSMPRGPWHFLFGALSAVLMKQYLLTISDKAIYFHRMNFFATRILQSERWSFSELNVSSIKSGLFNYELSFRFEDGRQLHFRLPRKSLSKKVAVLSTSTFQYLKANLF